ncbi:transcription activator effector-binding protein [Formosa sediminum]|uniref:Transcription activator effector-binding protein n=1 Tax=Formosa sediminum TaxID=2594004 RepID=A0A516GR02_9FLAO|nr:GyrI-like domain-containing protein [Formosa sediminum]QDO93923.1 transcription activator effector-binding protein [Formosa sediminum]
MKFTKYILFLLLIAFIGSSIYIAVQPNEISFSKTKIIAAPQEVAYTYINDLRHWTNWVPWKKTSTTDTNSNSKEYTWLQDNSIGRISTKQSSKPSHIQQDLVFHDYPKSELEWKIDSVSPKTSRVTLSMSSKNITFKKKAYYAIFGTPETDLAPKFETSLVALDSAIVKSMKVYSITINGVTNHSGGYYLYNTTTTSIDNYKSKVQQMMSDITDYIKENQIPMAGFPYVLYHDWNPENNTVSFSCCIPTTTQVISTNDKILTGLLPAFKTLKTTLKGDYNYLDKAWDAAFKHISANDLTRAKSNIMLESFITNPKYKVNPANWVTEIYIALADQDSTEQGYANLKLPSNNP